MVSTTTSTTTSTAAGGYMARIRAIVPGASSAKKMPVARNSKRDTIADARTKVAEKLRANKAWAQGTAGADKPDLVYKQAGDGSFAVGAKYGNRYLEGLFDGNTCLEEVPEEKLAELLEALASDAEAGLFDQYIEPIMKANVAARGKA